MFIEINFYKQGKTFLKKQYMKSKLTITLLLIFFITANILAQTLKGKVVDAVNNKALYGAAIKFTGNGGTTSDKNGIFSIKCSASKEITVTFIGYAPYKHIINNCNDEMDISLVPLENNLNDVEITATSTTNKSLLYQPSSITKLTKTELKRGTGLFMDDAINGNVPGVIMQRRAVSSGQQFNIRGYGNGSRGTRGVSSNFDGQGYKVYLNGIPVTDAEGITVMDDIDYGSIGNVEITKGPAGTLFGLAIAGAVNLETVLPEKGKTSIGQEVIVGNYGLQRYTTHFQTSNDHSCILLNYGHQKSDGFTVHNASHKDFVNFIGNFQVNEKESISSYFGYSNSYDQRSGELTIAQYDNSDFSGNLDYIKRDGHSQVYSARAGLSHTYNFNNHLANTTTLFATGYNSNVSSAGGWSDLLAINLGLRSTFNTKFVLKKGMVLSGITGVETQHKNAQTIGYSMVKNPLDTASAWALGNPYYWIIGGATGTNTSNGETSNVYSTTATTSVFTEWTLALPKDFSLTAGIGFSNMKIKLDDRLYNPATPLKTRAFDTSYGSMFSPHVAINKVFSKQFSVYASYSKAYKAPVSSYFYIPYAVGQTQAGIVNSNLKPEIGNQFEVGTKGELMNGNLTYQIAVFDAIFSNKMTNVAVPYNSTTTLFSYVVNGGKQENQGVEALVKYAVYKSNSGFLKSITPFGNVTYSHFKYKNFGFDSANGKHTDYSGNAVAGVAKWVANAGIDIATKIGLYGNVTYFYKDPMPITSDNSFYTSSYSLLNAKMGYQHALTSHFDLDIYLGINNINNTKYPIAVFVNQIPDAYLVGPVKANYFGGMNLKYNF